MLLLLMMTRRYLRFRPQSVLSNKVFADANLMLKTPPCSYEFSVKHRLESILIERINIQRRCSGRSSRNVVLNWC